MKDKKKFWFGLVLAVLPIVQKLLEGFGVPVPLPDIGQLGDILGATSAAAGTGLIAYSPAVGQNAR